MTHFFAMGGYAAFVWPAYVVTLLALGVALAITLRAYAAAKAMMDKLGADRSP